MEDPIKLGLYVLLLLPGFILVQTREYHLLREKRSQFEKTLDILLWSAAIWMIACAIKWSWPFFGHRAAALEEAQATFQYFAQGASPEWPDLLTTDAAIFFGSVCGWVFVLANIWGYSRKRRWPDGIIRFVTGRDWYPSVALKFFDQSVDSIVIVQTPSNRYLGTLHSAPDTKDDSYLILSEVAYFLKPGEVGQNPKPLPGVRWVLIRISDIMEMQVLTDEAGEPTGVTWWPGRIVRYASWTISNVFSTFSRK